jgi:hypothetical protein
MAMNPAGVRATSARSCHVDGMKPFLRQAVKRTQRLPKIIANPSPTMSWKLRWTGRGSG